MVRRYVVKKSNMERFWDYVEKSNDDDCWEWVGCIKKGYGSFWVRDDNYKNGGRMISAHRFIYEALVGPVEKGEIVHHTCEFKLCVNPKHLEKFSSYGQHTVQGHSNSLPAINKAKTHCIRGHEFTPENTLMGADGKRKCRTCQNEYLSKDKRLRIFRGEYKPTKKD